MPSQRGTSFSFGEDIATLMCQRLGLELICRAHQVPCHHLQHEQVCMDGYWFFAGKRLVTIFSAPNYCGAFANAGAIMEVNKDLVCTFHLFGWLTPAQNLLTPAAGPWKEGDSNYRRIISGKQPPPVSCDSVDKTPPTVEQSNTATDDQAEPEKAQEEEQAQP